MGTTKQSLLYQVRRNIKIVVARRVSITMCDTGVLVFRFLKV